MPKRAITQLFLERITAPKAGRIEYWDTAQPGLHLRLSPSGAGSWAVMYRVKGRQVRETLGTLTEIPKVADARARAEASQKAAEKGVHPVEARRTDEARAAANTISAAVERYLTWLEKEKKRRHATVRGYRQLFEHDVLPSWGERPVSSITDGDVLVLLNKKKTTRERRRRGSTEGAGVQANRLLMRLTSFFRWCTRPEQKLIAPDANPTLGLSKPVEEKPRDRALNGDEIKAFWAATDAIDAKRKDVVPFGALFRLLLVTAQRKSEVGGMRWSELPDYESARVWTIPPGRAKNGKAHIVHLSDLAVETLKTVPRATDRDLVFSGNGRTVASGFSRAKARCDRAMGVDDWTLHDLRRTATTSMAAIGVPPHVADRILNHTTGTITGVAKIYNVLQYVDERRLALDAVAHFVDLVARQGKPARTAEALTRKWMREEADRRDDEAAGNVVDLPLAAARGRA